MRKTATVTIPAGFDRDEGKVFQLTEMPAWQGEKWALRLFNAAARAGIDIPDDIASAGIAGLVAMGSRGLERMAGVAWVDMEPLLDEIFECIQRKESAATRALTDEDIEEIKTRLYLRGEVIKLHVDFTKLVALWGFQTPGTTGDSSNTSTSQEQSEP